MQEKDEVPAIRFAGFTDVWEQRKLGDIATFINGRAYSQSELLKEGKYKVLRVGNFYTNDSWYYSDLELSDKYYADYGDLLYTWSATFGPHIWLENKVIYHYHIWKIELSNQLEKHFTVQLLEQDKANILSRKNGSTMVHITKEGMEQKEVIIPPNIAEQRAIGAYFEKLDHLITLHQRKYSRLCSIKKSMLERMFPREGATVPEIRFAGFTDAWEQRKVKNIAPLQRGFDLPATQMKDGLYPVVMSNGIGGYHSIFKVKGPGVVTGRSGTLGKLHYIEKDYWPHNTSLWVTDFKENYPKFIYYLYQKLDLSWFGSGSGVPTLNRNDVHDAVVEIPQKSEQQKIAEFFGHLDHLITLHQHELERLQNIKKACLEKMFV